MSDDIVMAQLAGTLASLESRNQELAAKAVSDGIDAIHRLTRELEATKALCEQRGEALEGLLGLRNSNPAPDVVADLYTRARAALGRE